MPQQRRLPPGGVLLLVVCWAVRGACGGRGCGCARLWPLLLLLLTASCRELSSSRYLLLLSSA
jgi:hypothetical protein